MNTSQRTVLKPLGLMTALGSISVSSSFVQGSLIILYELSYTSLKEL